MSLQRLKKALSSQHRKATWWALGAAVVAVLVGVYIFFSFQVWSDLDKQSQARNSIVKGQLVAALNMKSTTEAEKLKKTTQIKAASEAINSQANTCEVPFLFAWQQSLGSNTEKLEQCKTTAAKLQKIKSSLDAVVIHIENEQMLSQLIAGVGVSQQAGEADWPDIAKQWGDAETAMSKKAVAESFKSAQDLAKKQAGALQDAWQALIAANAAKDRAQYETAVATIAANYKSLGEVSQLSQAGLQPLIAEFELIYNKTF